MWEKKKPTGEGDNAPSTDIACICQGKWPFDTRHKKS